jgi:hypothetical protein
MGKGEAKLGMSDALVIWPISAEGASWGTG